MKKRIAAMLLSVLLIAALLPNIALSPIASDLSGECGEELTWSFEPQTGVLTLSGSGEMYNYQMGKAPWQAYGSQILELSLPEGMTRIGSHGFCNLSGVRELHLPETLETIELCAFIDCTALTALEIPDSVTLINDNAFMGCSGLETVKLSAALDSVNPAVFSSCTGLKEMDFPEGMTEICEYAFNGCTGLQKLSFPSTMKEIGRRAFGDCSSLEKLKLPNNLQSIGSLAFQGCTGLDSVTIPNSVETVGSGAFMDCTGLREVILRNPNCLIGVADGRAQTSDSGEDLKLSPGSVQSDSGENLVYDYQYAPYTLGTAENTIIYSKHDEALAETGEIEQDRKLSRYPETYAETYGYRFFPINTFTDVKDGAYYQIAVAWAVGNKITGGTGGGKFSPSKTCTREQVVTFLHAAAGKPDPTLTECPFTDVKPGKYYYNAVLWALENKITGGTSATTFGVGKGCTREQVVTFLHKVSGSPEPSLTECAFTDVNPNKYYYKSVLWALENGVTSGMNATTFGVGKTCTRAQIVTFLYAAMR